MKPVRYYCSIVLLQVALFAFVSPVVRAEDAAGQYVSRQEYEELKAELLAMKKELAGLKKARHAESNQESPKSQAAAAESAKVVTPPSAPLEESILGTTKFHMAGFGTSTFEARNGRVSNFSVNVTHIF